MADLTITTCRPVRVEHVDIVTGPANEVVALGAYVRLDATTGYITNGNATTAAEVGHGARGIAIQDASLANLTVSFVKKGILDVGDALAALNYGVKVYLSDTDGTLGTVSGDGTVATIVGSVVPGYASTTPDKLLFVDVEGN